LYGACFSFIYGSSGAQSGVALLFMGFYSLPVMVPIWGVAVFLKRKLQLEKPNPESTNPDSP
jgi:drug/metabolite transporter (DMT)-like permease